ncbi:MAG: DNA polymerase III subunit delta, partial [Bdellovibrionia bacterium]
MPKIELKAVQRELEKGQVWPVYWIYGHEKFKSRELLKRIRKAVSDSSEGTPHLSQWGEEHFVASSSLDAESIVDAACSLTLGGGTKLVIVQDAHLLKKPEPLAALFGPSKKKEELPSVCILLSKDLDGRKKFSKLLQEKAAVISCEEVTEDQRESWVQDLAKRRKVELTSHLLMKLCTLDPWSLDIIDQELEKFSVAGLIEDVVLEGSGRTGGMEVFIDQFFQRHLQTTISHVSYFADAPDEALPLLGLLGWNVRQLAVLLSDRENGTRYAKLAPYVEERFRKWSGKWSLNEILRLQQELANLDFKIKQTP